MGRYSHSGMAGRFELCRLRPLLDQRESGVRGDRKEERVSGRDVVLQEGPRGLECLVRAEAHEVEGAQRRQVALRRAEAEVAMEDHADGQVREAALVARQEAGHQAPCGVMEGGACDRRAGGEQHGEEESGEEEAVGGQSGRQAGQAERLRAVAGQGGAVGCQSNQQLEECTLPFGAWEAVNAERDDRGRREYRGEAQCRPEGCCRGSAAGG